MGSAPVGVQCPLTSSLCEFMGSGDLGFRPCWCPSPFPSPFMHISVFSIHSSSPAIGFHSCILHYGRRICTHSVDPSLTHFLVEFPGLGLALVSDDVVPEAEQGCAWNRNLDPNFYRGRGKISDL